ncbi:hypothetical protein EOA60_13295 [Mesorhizobium sp. M1A.F.Ca.IN.020.06.1.1]|nr:hypothetical protein CK214_11450 [Mesorhizobium sp. WSM3882]RUV02910.1 hypothetical protein EOA79_16850 [Mesorhizobium sp. M1A.F.Ca.IN.020.03.2.1]RUV86195.1 hypothetical protein EOA51_15645 [Mesorhizobium sp. M1A.F.Ca.IN.020.32.1.1]RUW10214.1 hypothetical protein EOA46_15905 [Mesorhizobium sp. M1A.F.Ca.IN.022.05.2.1]RUW30535.1 hypothetical protein EOA60_13295 [Mesorhizobium sp. M1A.F.Ca.IN.020.06.1.1]RWF76414.1 MAG: hypothetical protein EOQ35_27045 [Mesorhizobium sp.]
MRSVPLVQEFKPFLFSYRYEGAEWNIEIPARSWEDAKRRASALALGKCEGEVIARIPARFGLVARLTAFIRNAISQR